MSRGDDDRGRRGAAHLAAAALVILGVMTATPAGAGQDPLAPRERAIVAHARAHADEGIALLERAVNINSGTLNLAGVRKVGDLFATELRGLGFTTTWVDGAPFGRAGHLVAQRPGPGPRVLLIGHLDTVFEPDSPFQTFTRVDRASARGPGVLDMKGGNVIILQALRALASVGALDEMNLTVFMTGDEESAGDPQEVARAALVDVARGAQMAIGFEDGDGDPAHAVIGRRGTTSWTLRVTATAAHSSQIFREDIGYGAIFETARILNAFRETLSSEAHLTFNPAVQLGGTQVTYDAANAKGTASGKDNVIPAQAVVVGDLRALSKEQFASARERMTRIVSEGGLAHTKAEIAFDEGYPPMAPTEGNQKLLAIYDQASRDIGAGSVTAVNPDRAGAADVSFVAGLVPMILDGIGMRGDGGHTTDETADLATFPTQVARAAILLYRARKAQF